MQQTNRIPSYQSDQDKTASFSMSQVRSFVQDMATIDEGISKRKKCLQSKTLGKSEGIQYNPKALLGKSILTEGGDKLRKYRFPVNKEVRKIISKHKIKNLTNAFTNKLTRSIKPLKSKEEEDERASQSKINFLTKRGFSMPLKLQILLNFVNVLIYLALCSLFSFGLVFNDLFYQNELITALKAVCLVALAEIFCISMTTISQPEGKKLETFQKIIGHYLHGEFIIDILCLIVLIIDLASSSDYVKYLRIFYLFKVSDLRNRICKLEFTFINGFYREQYWGLIKIFLVDFFFAHFIATVLIIMASLDENSWMLKAAIEDKPWFEKYSWAYYWAVTTMLTVGYGDLSAANYKQAICLIFVQIFSCIVFAHTINCIGNLVNNIRSKDEQKNRNFKILKKISEKNNISQSIEEKVSNYISETIEIHKKFNYEEQKKLVEELPIDVKRELLKECNFKLFEKIPLFKIISEKTISQLAIKITLIIAHPEEVILHHNSPPKFQILKEGKIGYYTIEENGWCRCLMNQVRVASSQSSVLLNMNFLTMEKQKYNILSLGYSILYLLQQNALVDVIRGNQHDLQSYFFEKDKSKHILDEYQVIPCEQCKTMHTKATCPKLHFVPLKQITIFKHLKKQKNCKMKKMAYVRWKDHLLHPYEMFRELSEMEPNIFSLYRTENSEQRRADTKFFGLVKNEQISMNKINIASLRNLKSKQLIINSFNGLECDQLCDFKNYFTECNPKQILVTFKQLKKDKFKKKKMTTLNLAENEKVEN